MRDRLRRRLRRTADPHQLHRALAALIQQLVTLAAVIFGSFVVIRILGSSGRDGGGTTVHIRKAVIKCSYFHG